MQLTHETGIDPESDCDTGPPSPAKLAEAAAANSAESSSSSSSSPSSSSSDLELDCYGAPITLPVDDGARLVSAKPRVSSAPQTNGQAKLSSLGKLWSSNHSSHSNVSSESSDDEEPTKFAEVPISGIIDLSTMLALTVAFSPSNSNYGHPRRLSCRGGLAPHFSVAALTNMPVEIVLAITHHLSVRDLCTFETVCTCMR
jgi:hypothetical protein